MCILSNFFLALLLAPAVLTSPLPIADVETTSLAQIPGDIFRRDLDAYKPASNVERLCHDHGFDTASPLDRKCTDTAGFQVKCVGGGKPQTLVAGRCNNGYMCLPTMPGAKGRRASVATPNYKGIRDLICMKIKTEIVKGVEEGAKASITPLSPSPPIGVGHMYGTFEVQGDISHTHPTLEWDIISDGISGALGQRTIGDIDNATPSRAYSIEANYEDSARFAALVKDLSPLHGTISMRMSLAYFASPIKAQELPMM
ncbi:unnamed protein product [Zymoseptoria tritici ST99CH_1A5]|uniref:Uncharacterized protein n=1 Tax=Zymoseptoria tritici ST99CH_1A5 TaxID=1276529 RepID=A0A1Y6LQS6_ZYMTR|nr:unnamed protein product [Zymoseptoria tritici ST99CH_1A5]